MIEARDLTRRYGDFTAVDGISFEVADGEILGILGPNGAGKTTTIRMITGFLPPSQGQVTLDGENLVTHPTVARRHLGYLPENVALYTEMRVDEYLRYRARLAGLGRGEASGAIDRSIHSCLLGEVRHQVIGTLSKGYRQRVGLAAAILHGPRVLVLDEPTVGLDPKQIIAIRELIRELGRERTLLLSTHILPEVEQLCDRVLIIDRGRLIASGTPAELRSLAGGRREILVTVDPGEAEEAGVDAAERLAALDGITAVSFEPLPHGSGEATESSVRFRLECPGTSTDGDGDPRRQVFHLAVDQGWTLLELSEKRVSLEDTFVRLTAGQGADPSEIREPETASSEIVSSGRVS